MAMNDMLVTPLSGWVRGFGESCEQRFSLSHRPKSGDRESTDLNATSIIHETRLSEY